LTSKVSSKSSAGIFNDFFFQRLPQERTKKRLLFSSEFFEKYHLKDEIDNSMIKLLMKFSQVSGHYYLTSYRKKDLQRISKRKEKKSRNSLGKVCGLIIEVGENGSKFKTSQVTPHQDYALHRSMSDISVISMFFCDHGLAEAPPIFELVVLTGCISFTPF
jgi:hypothetical protein